MISKRTVRSLLSGILTVAVTTGGATDIEAGDAERRWTERAASAEQIDLYAPAYRLDGDQEGRLFLMNTTAGPLVATVRALSAAGDRRELGSYPIDSLEHLELDLGSLLQGEEGGDFDRGALEVELLGDGESLQGWLVQREGGEVFEVPLMLPDPTGPSEQVAFWQGSRGRGAPHFSLFNSSAEPRDVEIAWQLPGRARERTQTVSVPPRRLVVIDGGAAPSAVRFRDPSRTVLIVGWGEDGPVPLEPIHRLSTTRRFESLPLLAAGQSPAVVREVSLVFWNGGDQVRRPGVDLLDEAGHVVGSVSMTLPPGAVRRVEPSEIVERLRETPSLRLRISSDDPGILIRGRVVWQDGTSTPIALYDADLAHMNGTYPLPDPERHRVETTILNLGTEPSRIVAQVNWSGGTHALGPFEIAPGEVLRLEPGQIAEEAAEDILGRVLDPHHPAGVLKWTVASGSTTLLGRTSVRPIDPADGEARADRFGFDCFGCCWQTPRGEVVPTLVKLAEGQMASVQACVTYDTCSGTMGPYPTAVQSKTVPPEISWDGSQLTMNTAVDADIEFEGNEILTSPGCLVFWRGIFGRARAEGCNAMFNPQEYDPAVACVTQTNGICIACRACCNNLYQAALCRGKQREVIDTDLRLCLGHCTINLYDCEN